MRTTIKLGKLTLTRRSYNEHPPYIWEFLDVDGNRREIVDEDRNVMRLVEAAKEGSGKLPQANQRRDFGVGEGLPPDNLVTRGDNQGQPQRPYAGTGRFLDG